MTQRRIHGKSGCTLSPPIPAERSPIMPLPTPTATLDSLSIDAVDDAAAAAAFRRLVRHLQHRDDAANIDLMGLAGFCRNCLGDWLAEADPSLTRADAREMVHAMPAAAWKARQPAATETQLARMEASRARNPVEP